MRSIDRSDVQCSSKISISIFPRVKLIPNDLAIKQDINNIQIPKVEIPEENKSLYVCSIMLQKLIRSLNESILCTNHKKYQHISCVCVCVKSVFFFFPKK
jgi:hypothetical protein